MNILILNWRDPKNPKAGGAEVVTLEYAKGWKNAGHNIVWLSTKFPHAPKQEIFEGITVQRMGNALTSFIFFPFFYFFSGNSFDVVIDEVHGLPFLTPLYVRKPIIGFIHEVAGDIWDSMYPFPLSLIGKILERVFFIPYKHIPFLTVSESTKKDLIKMGIGKEHIFVIQNGLSNTVRSSLPEKNKKFTFLFVSRLVKMKGVEDVIKAFSYIKKKEQDVQLLIVGAGEKKYMKLLERLAMRLGISDSVFFKGYVSQEEKLAFMAKSHILLHASVKEGWGLVVIESASQGTPSVVYDTAGLRDSVLKDKTGIILKENQPKVMADEAVHLLLNRKRYRDYQMNCLRWAKSLVWRKSIQRSLELLEQYV